MTWNLDKLEQDSEYECLVQVRIYIIVKITKMLLLAMVLVLVGISEHVAQVLKKSCPSWIKSNILNYRRSKQLP